MIGCIIKFPNFPDEFQEDEQSLLHIKRTVHLLYTYRKSRGQRLSTCSLNLNITLVSSTKPDPCPGSTFRKILVSDQSEISLKPDHLALLSLSTQTIFFNEYKKQKFIEINVQA